MHRIKTHLAKKHPTERRPHFLAWLGKIVHILTYRTCQTVCFAGMGCCVYLDVHMRVYLRVCVCQAWLERQLRSMFGI
jgi:hypothetical protein